MRIKSAGQLLSVAAADQIAFAASNSLLSVAVARQVSTEEFGRFALAYLAIVAMTAIARQAFGTTAMLAEVSGPSEVERRTASFENAVWLGAMLGTAATLFGLLAMVVFGAHPWTLVLSAAAPALAADQLRGAAVSRNRQIVSLQGSLLWIAVLLLAMLTSGSAGAAVVCWAAGAAASGVWIASRLSLRPQRPSISALGEADMRSARSLAVDASAAMLYRQVLFWFLAAYLGVAAVGSLRAAQTVFSPAAVVTAGMTSGISPRMREHGSGSRERSRLRLLATLVVLAVAIAVGALLLALPSVGTFLVGRSWSVAAAIAPLIFIVRIADGLSMAGQLELIADGRTQILARTRIAASIASIALPTGGALLSGVTGAVAGMALASSLMVPIWWRRASGKLNR